MIEELLIPSLIMILIAYGLGFFVLCFLTLLPIKSIFQKKFSLAKLLKKAIDVFTLKPTVALILLVLVFFHALGGFFISGSNTFSNLADSKILEDRSPDLKAIVNSIAIGSAGIGMIIFLIGSPFFVLGQGFLIFVYANYLKTKKIDPGLWRKLISLKGLYLIIASLISVLLIFSGLLVFIFPALILAWSFFYVPYLIVLKDENPISAFFRSFSIFRARPWDTIFLFTVYTAAHLLLLTPGLESFLHFLVVLPIINFMVVEYIAGGKI
jgi:hypothetical protein